jgi:hypothetical protein
VVNQFSPSPSERAEVLDDDRAVGGPDASRSGLVGTGVERATAAGDPAAVAARIAAASTAAVATVTRPSTAKAAEGLEGAAERAGAGAAAG